MSDKDLEVERRWHPEYQGYVWQPIVPGATQFIEPYVHKAEAKAFIKGVKLVMTIEDSKNG